MKNYYIRLGICSSIDAKLHVVLFGLLVTWNIDIKQLMVEMDSKANLALMETDINKNLCHTNVLY